MVLICIVTVMYRLLLDISIVCMYIQCAVWFIINQWTSSSVHPTTHNRNHPPVKHTIYGSYIEWHASFTIHTSYCNLWCLLNVSSKHVASYMCDFAHYTSFVNCHCCMSARFVTLVARKPWWSYLLYPFLSFTIVAHNT